MARKNKGKQGKKGKKGFLPEHTAGVSKEVKHRITYLLKYFKKKSAEEVYTFKANMNKQERAMVHMVSIRMGMTSKSSGEGEQRQVSVYKTKKNDDGKKKNDGGKSKKKTKTLDEESQETHISSFAFSEESKRVLVDLFMHYPPGEDQDGEQKLHDQTRDTDKLRGGIDDTFLRPVMGKEEIARKLNSLTCKIATTPKLAEIFVKRSKLPIASFRGAITSTIANHQVVLICGETGCGKTTQVPQYLLDHMWAKGEACKIICTQPRRISAISVSERIAQERGETIGDTVGYKIRLEAIGGRQSSILFCTSGVLLRVLVSSRESESGASRMKAEKYISELTHIVVDEIHERDRYSDFMLTILRDLLPAHPHLRLVLMSATIDAERFSEYFGGCPVVRVPGFTHPVKTFYLEEVLSMLKTPERNHLNDTPTLPTCSSNLPKLSKEYQVALDEAIELSLSNEEFDSLLELISSEGKPEVLNHKHSSTGVTPLMVFAGKGRVNDVCTLLSLGADCHIQARDGTTALDWAKRGEQIEAAEIIKKHMEAASSGPMEELQLLEKYMKKANPDVIDYVLIEQLLKKLCVESRDGAILVFLPGWEDISRTQRTLLANSFFNDPSRFLVLPLHSMVPSAEQKKVFEQPPRGCRKIILSTNIAETSVTIDDVVYVIDSGRMKEKSYDPLNNVSTLQSSWISKASAKQREGRAGRCQPGVCFHLYSKLKAVSLADFQVPEIKRMPIEELCLQVKMLDPNSKVVEFLNRTLDPPVLETINNAIAVLQDIGALSLDEQLTDLGKKLGSLPVHPLTSRMLFFAILVNCLEPALTLACAADYRDPFTVPMLPTDKLKADMARAKLASLYGGQSDQLATVAAFDCWKSAKERGRESWFCSQNYVSRNIMSMLSGMRRQLLNELKRCGFVPDDVSSCSLNSRDPGIVQAVLVAGLYPRVGRLGPPPMPGRPYFVKTCSVKRARLLSRSVLTKLPRDELYNEHGEGPLLLYDEVTRGDAGLQVRSCTVISPLPLLLLAKEIAVASGEGKKNDPSEEDGKSGSPADGDKKDSDNGQTESLKGTSKEEGIMISPDNSVKVVIDGWVSFKVTALEVAQIYCLRERLSAAILFKISYPRKVLPPPLAASTYAVACLMAYDGRTGISLPMAPSVDILTSLARAPDSGYKKEKNNNNKKKEKSFSNAQAKDVVNPSSSREILPPPTAPAKDVVVNPSSSREILPPPTAPAKDVVVNPSSSGEILPPLTAPPPRERPICGLPLLVSPPPDPPQPTLQKRKRENKPQKTGGAPPPRERPISELPLSVGPPPVPPQPTLQKRKRENKPQKTGGGAGESLLTPMIEQQPNGATAKNGPCVQGSATAPKKTKRKNKAQTQVTRPGVANLAPKANPTPFPGLSALVSGLSPNPFGPYGPRGR